jgi:hypothetical protein
MSREVTFFVAILFTGHCVRKREDQTQVMRSILLGVLQIDDISQAWHTKGAELQTWLNNNKREPDDYHKGPSLIDVPAVLCQIG